VPGPFVRLETPRFSRGPGGRLEKKKNNKGGGKGKIKDPRQKVRAADDAQPARYFTHPGGAQEQE